MAAAVSQLCVWQGRTHSSGFISTRAVKVEQISPLFHLYLYLFFKSEEYPFFANLACQSRIIYCTAQIFAQAYKTRRIPGDQGTSVILVSATRSRWISMFSNL